MFRPARAVLLATIALGVAPATAGAVPAKKLATNLGALWTTVLQTPSAQNSFGSGGAVFGCFQLKGKVVAPFGPTGVPACTVKTGTKVFVAATSWECSTFAGDHPGFGTTEADLRACARQYDAQVAPVATLDGEAIPITAVETQLLSIALPADNILAPDPPGQRRSVAHGWVAFLHPLTPGTHTIVINSAGSTVTTTITVKPGQ